MEFLPWTPLQHPLLPTSVTPLQQTRWCWNLGRTFYTFQTKTNLNLTQIQRWIWEEQLIELKIQRLCYKYLLQHNFLPCLILAHTFSRNTSPHIRTKNPSSHFILFFFFLRIHPKSSSLVSLHDLPWTCSPCPMKALKSLALINGLLILLKPMKIENKLPSNWV